MYLEKINTLTETYATLKRIDKYKLRFNSRRWTTLSLQKSVSVKNNYLLSSLILRTLH